MPTHRPGARPKRFAATTFTLALERTREPASPAEAGLPGRSYVARIGDADLELEAQSLLPMVQDDPEQMVAGFHAVWELGRARGRWQTAATARRTEAAFLLDTDPVAAAAALDEAAEVAVAHGLREVLAWVGY